MIQYREEGHTYFDGDEVIPSVTQILSDGTRYTPGSAERGTVAHEACASFALNPEGLIPDNDYAQAFAMWVYTRDPKFLEVEGVLEGCLNGKRYAGRLDGLCQIDGKLVVVDWKTGAKASTHHAQVAAYALVKQPAKCLVLYLHKDGSYDEDWLSATKLAAGVLQFTKAIQDYGTM